MRLLMMAGLIGPSVVFGVFYPRPSPPTFTGAMGTSRLTFGSDPAEGGDVAFENATGWCTESAPASTTEVCVVVDENEDFLLSGSAGTQFMAPDGSAGGPGYAFVNNSATGLYLAAANTAGISGGGNEGLTVNSTGVDQFVLRQADLTANCTLGQVALDTANTKELCVCQATNTWYCIAVTDATGPAD